MQKKCTKICVCRKKAVPLHPLFSWTAWFPLGRTANKVIVRPKSVAQYVAPHKRRARSRASISASGAE